MARRAAEMREAARAAEHEAELAALDVERAQLEAERATLPVKELLSPKEVAKILSVHRSTVFYMAREDASFPKPLKLSRNTPRWRVTELNAWLAARAAARGR